MIKNLWVVLYASTNWSWGRHIFAYVCIGLFVYMSDSFNTAAIEAETK